MTNLPASVPDLGPGSPEAGSRPVDLQLPSLRGRLRRFVAMLAVLSLLAGWQALGASAQSIDDLRGDIPTGDELRDEIAQIAAARAEALAERAAAEARLSDVLFQRDELDDTQRRLAAEIEAATTNLRRLAVEAFITGGEVGTLEYLAAVRGASDFAWRQYLVRSHAGSSRIAVERLRSLRDRADSEVLESIAEAEELRIEIAVLEAELSILDDRDEAIDEVMPLAEAWDRAAIAVAEGAWGIAPNDKWERLRFCESTHNYQAISPSGTYRGAYQFDFATWQTVGGTGDPAAAPAEEQDARARELYARRGHQPWPECGRFLQ
ncbi:MAG: transglycosylase family protein [Pseudomonadota bacterium]